MRQSQDIPETNGNRQRNRDHDVAQCSEEQSTELYCPRPCYLSSMKSDQCSARRGEEILLEGGRTPASP
jgi:hypothetical protein